VRDEQISQVVGSSAVAFGVLGMLLPRLLAKLLGTTTDTGEFVYLMRLAGAGNLGLGVNLLTASSEDRRRLLGIASAVDGLCCLFAVGAGFSGALSKRTGAMLAITTGSVAVTAAMPLLGSKS
jgi:hypothetical protein